MKTYINISTTIKQSEMKLCSIGHDIAIIRPLDFSIISKVGKLQDITDKLF